ncbi:MAG: SGNH/GDSL hydrolase family protein [Candidatus Omnitrophica bacterium]|nr:SGNH/GDSL hydrolase family protein [Candidatus Omnitrophota bacterium]
MKNIFINCLISIIACISVCILLELYIRIEEPPDHGKLYIKSKNKILKNELMPNVDVVRLGKRVTINAGGYRGTYYKKDKDTQTFRIAVLGDSFTFGHGVTDEETYCAQLEKLLVNSSQSRTFEVLNFGVNDYTTQQEFELFKVKVGAYNPDVVILGYYYNDLLHTVSSIKPDLRSEKKIARERKKSMFDFQAKILRTVRKSYSLRFLTPRINALLRRFNIRGYGESGYFNYQYVSDSLPWQYNKKILLDFNKECKKRNATLLVMLIVDALKLDENYPYKETHEIVRSFCDSNNIVVLDLYKELKGQNFTRYRSTLLDAHPNKKLHGIYAKILYNFISEHTLIN